MPAVDFANGTDKDLRHILKTYFDFFVFEKIDVKIIIFRRRC